MVHNLTKDFRYRMNISKFGYFRVNSKILCKNREKFENAGGIQVFKILCKTFYALVVHNITKILAMINRSMYCYFGLYSHILKTFGENGKTLVV